VDYAYAPFLDARPTLGISGGAQRRPLHAVVAVMGRVMFVYT